MNEKQLKDAKEMYQSWSVDQLTYAMTVEKQDYAAEALDLMALELSRRGISQAEKADAERQVAERVETEVERLTGIRGFLLLFVISVVLGSMLSVLFGLVFLKEGFLFATFTPFNFSLKSDGSSILVGVVSLGLAGYGFYSIYVLLRKRRTAVQHAERLLLLAIAAVCLNGLVIWIVTDHKPLLLSVVVVASRLGTAYLSRSRRVANTYGLQGQDTSGYSPR